VTAFTGVFCKSGAACVAVGPYTAPHDPSNVNSDQAITLAERWDGRAWAIQPTANGTGSVGGQVYSVACPAATACFAVGTTTALPSRAQITLTEAWNGTSWTVQNTPSLSSPAILNSVSCASTTFCMAVGYSNSADGGTLAERWDGTRWSVIDTSDLDAAGAGTLLGVSCTSSTFCAVTGGAHFPTFDKLVLATWDGGTWRPQTGTGFLGSISCVSESNCLAVGASESGPYSSTETATWDGTTWTIPPTSPPGPVQSELADVSCATADACRAIFFTEGPQFSTNPPHSLIVSLIGADIGSPTQPSVPSGLPYGPELAGLSCAASTSCTTIGSYQLQASGPYVAFSADWDGTTWTTRTIPDPVNLAAISCSSPMRCTAVGWDKIGPVAERYG
jgi:hypothetical protein